jgi:hypothetical protein
MLDRFISALLPARLCLRGAVVRASEAKEYGAPQRRTIEKFAAIR